MSIPNLARPTNDRAAQSQPGPFLDCERWYAVHSLPFAEARAEGQLQRQGFRTFQPKRHRTLRHAHRLSTVEAPYFPAICSSSSISPAISGAVLTAVLGYRGWMRGDQPHPIPRGVVEALIAAADARGILQLGGKLQVGGPVRLIAGPFAEQLAILDHLEDSGRVRVLLNILGRQVAISTVANNILPVS